MALRFVNTSGSETSPYETEAKAANTIQTAVTGASGGDIIVIRNDAAYTLASAVNIGVSLTFVGYQATGGQPTAAIFDGDMSFGGAFYKTNRVTVTGGAFSAFTYSGNLRAGFFNIDITGTTTGFDPIDLVTNTTVASQSSFYMGNCHVDGGTTIDLVKMDLSTIEDSKFTGTWAAPDVKAMEGVFSNASGCTIYNNFFKVDAADGYINFIAVQNKDTTNVVFGNIFTMGAGAAFDKEMVRTVHGGMIFNNIFHQPAGTSFGNGINGTPKNAALGMVTSSSTELNTAVFGNIFFSEETGASRFNGIWADKVTYRSTNNCLFNTLNDNYTLTATDITANPQFVDIANGNYRLQPSSPCLNTGMPTIYGDGLFGKSSMGAWQPNALAVQEYRARQAGSPLYR